jgi:hypothetical protein
LALTRREFLAGGVIHTPAFGVLIGVLGLAGLRTGELPRPLAVTALASASACLLAPLYFVAEPFAWFIPAGRFPGLIVSGIAGTRLARSGRPSAGNAPAAQLHAPTRHTDHVMAASEAACQPPLRMSTGQGSRVVDGVVLM